ncbi:hypothetical protein QUB56_24495 [Microcoleus sp. AR_TQ3_B6]|uniref:DUF7507 domain-containing protein n=1 Tax=Microcoleus sp. AR_TQ3_B6 TaxID=3055284 RepID=UPI002FD5B3E7
MTTYSTVFNQQFGASNEPINALFEFDQDFTGDGLNDIQVTLSLNPGANSGTEDMLGVAFDIAGDATSGLQIVNIDRSEQSNTQTLSTFNPTVVIGPNQVSDSGPLDPGFNTSGSDSAEPYDVGIKFSEQGSGEGIVQTASFVISKPGAFLDKSLIENTNWWVRLQSTNGGGESAKTGGFIGMIPGGGTPPTPNPSIFIDKVTNGADGLNILAGELITWTYTVSNTGNVPLSNITVTDDKETGLTYSAGDANSNALLDTNEVWTYTKTGTAQPGNYSNTGSVTGNYNGTPVSSSDPSSYFGADPKIAIDKVTRSAPVQGDGLLVPQGSPISWIYTVTNTGNVPLSNVQVTDNQGVVPVYQSGDTNLDGKLDLTESWVYSANGTAILGSYQNTGTVQGSYTDDLTNPATPTDSDDSSYTGMLPPGARTPGFWSNWPAVWNANASDDSSFAGRAGFPTSDILRPPYTAATRDPVTGQITVGILVGDYNRNGQTDAGENTLFYTLQEARTIVNASLTQQQDRRYTLDRSLIASWLNYLAVNPAPTGDMSQAIMWLQRSTPDENGDGKGDGNLSLQASTYRVPASSPAWSNLSNTYNGLPTGEVLNNKLDSYNNTGLFGPQPII